MFLVIIDLFFLIVQYLSIIIIHSIQFQSLFFFSLIFLLLIFKINPKKILFILKKLIFVFVFIFIIKLIGENFTAENIYAALIPLLKLVNMIFIGKIFIANKNDTELLKFGRIILYPLIILKVNIIELSKIFVISIKIIYDLLEDTNIRNKIKLNKNFISSISQAISDLYFYIQDKTNSYYNNFNTKDFFTLPINKINIIKNFIISFIFVIIVYYEKY